MTIAQLAQLVARRSPWKSVASMPMAEAHALAVCITRGLNEWFGSANRAWTTQPLNYVLQAPLTTAIACTKDSALYGFVEAAPAWTFDSTNFTFDGTEQTFDEFGGYVGGGPPSWLVPAFGSSVRVGEGYWNRVLSSTVMLWPFTGETSANQSVQIYHNGVNLGRSIKGLEGGVELMDVNGKFIRHLREAPEKRFETGPPEIAEPTEYQLESVNTGFGVAPAWVLRLNPAPATRYILRAQVSRYIVDVTLADLRRDGRLPIPDDVASSIIFPITLDLAAAENLLDAEAYNPRRVESDAQVAREKITNRSQPASTTPNWSGTPAGF